MKHPISGWATLLSAAFFISSCDRVDMKDASVEAKLIRNCEQALHNEEVYQWLSVQHGALMDENWKQDDIPNITTSEFNVSIKNRCITYREYLNGKYGERFEKEYPSVVWKGNKKQKIEIFKATVSATYSINIRDKVWPEDGYAKIICRYSQLFIPFDSTAYFLKLNYISLNGKVFDGYDALSQHYKSLPDGARPDITCRKSSTEACFEESPLIKNQCMEE
jgi:hypothetical protein